MIDFNLSGDQEGVVVDDNIEIGNNIDNQGTNNVLLGNTTEAYSNNVVAIGDGAQSTNVGGVSVGSDALSGGDEAVAIGSGAQAIAPGSVQIGAGTNNNQDSFQFGNVVIVDGTGHIPMDTLPTEVESRLDALESADGNTYTETDPVSMPILEHHMETDASRWQDYYATKLTLAEDNMVLQGYKIDMTNFQVVQNPTASETFTVNTNTGAVFAYYFTNSNGQFSTITDNGSVVWSSDGIVEGSQLVGGYSIIVSSTDDPHTIVFNNMQMIEMLGYLPDPASPFNSLNGGWVSQNDFHKHISTDITRWSDTYEFEGQLIEGIIEAKGMIQDTANTVDVTNYNTGIQNYPVTNPLGGLLTVNITNTDTAFCNIFINNNEVYSSNGLIAGSSVVKYYHMNNGDNFRIPGAISGTFTPYIADPNSQMQQMLASINMLNQKVSDLQQQVNDNEAAINNKTVANVTPIDITNTSYTVNNALGARITGQGSQVLGLLGITVASTGTVNVNGTEVYNNTSLLSGTPEILSINVEDGAVISSSGMSYVDVYNYVAG